MKNKSESSLVITLLVLLGIGAVAALALTLGAGSLFVITTSSGGQPTPVERYDSPSAGYQPVMVNQVEVEVGVGSPIPVHVLVSGNLPDSCAQVEYSEIQQDGSNFIITLSAVPSRAEDCVQDTLPFRMSIPLNVLDLPIGDYSVTVNGLRADFSLDASSSTSTLRTADMPVVKRDLQVDDVNIEIGVGSPIPVKAVISANLPNSCAQLGEVRLYRDGTNFIVRLVAYVPTQTDCNPDALPFRLEIPLNIVNMPEGPYEVNVNGVTASFDPRTGPAESGNASGERNLIAVENVEVQVGVGSPIPVEVVASGTWPDLCAQIAEVQSNVNGFQIDVTVLASTVEVCPPDHLGLPFRYAFPLNTVEMESGTYTITVNGTSTTFELPIQPK